MAEPVTLAEMRAHLGITQASDTSRDDIISARITTARTMAEHHTDTIIVGRTVRAYHNRFEGDGIRLKMPLQSVTSIKYIDTSGVEQTLDPLKYHVDAIDGYVYPSYGNSWPDARLQANSVTIEYVSGYADPTTAPENVKDAIRFMVAQWEVFQTSIEGVVRPFTIPNAAKQLLDVENDYRGSFYSDGFRHVPDRVSALPPVDPNTLYDSNGEIIYDSNGESLIALETNVNPLNLQDSAGSNLVDSENSQLSSIAA